jgi:hypothetical protein
MAGVGVPRYPMVTRPHINKRNLMAHMSIVQIVPIVKFEAFRALQLSKLESFRAIKPYGESG